MKRMRGQSTVEFAVGAASLLLLWLGLLALAGMQEAERRLMVASRHAAFSRIWHPAGTAPAAPLRLHSSHFSDAGYVRPFGDPHWITSEDVQSAAAARPLTGIAGTASEVLLRPLQVAGGFLGAGFDLRPDGYATGEVRVRLRPQRGLPPPFDTLDLWLDSAMHLLGDGWSASGTPQVRARTAGLVPTARLAAMSEGWRALAAPLAIVEPNLDRLCLGLIEPEQVPEDRLGPARRLRAGEACR